MEAKAEAVQDTAIAIRFEPATITADFPAMRERLQAMIAPYAEITPELAASMDIKEAKQCRADLNAISRQLNDDRKAIKKVYNEPLKAFEDEVKALDAMIKAPCEVIDQAIKMREEQERAYRRGELEKAYCEMVIPELADAVPFDMLLDPKWLNKSFGEKKAEDALYERVRAVTADWEALKRTQLRFPQESEAVFFRTLSLREAVEHDARRQAEQERIDALKAQTEAYADEVPCEPETAPQAEPEPPQIVQAAEDFVAAVERFEEVRTYQITVDATAKQRDALVAWFKANGVHGTIREVCNG